MSPEDACSPPPFAEAAGRHIQEMTKAPFDRDGLIDTIRQNGGRPKHALVYYRDGEADLLRESLQAGADLDAIIRPKLRWTMVQDAERDGPDDLFGEILAKSRNVNHKDRDGDTALHFAVGAGSARKVSALVAAGARASSRNAGGVAPINLLVWLRDDDARAATAAALVSAAGSLDIRSGVCGSAPLHDMAQIGDAETARVLIAGGATARIRNEKGLRPSQVARAAGFDATADALDVEEERERRSGKIPRARTDRGRVIAAAARARAREDAGRPAAPRGRRSEEVR